MRAPAAAVLLSLLVAGALMAGPGPAQGPAGGASRLAGLAWMAGHWLGQLGAMTIEEHWAPALGGTMNPGGLAWGPPAFFSGPHAPVHASYAVVGLTRHGPLYAPVSALQSRCSGDRLHAHGLARPALREILDRLRRTRSSGDLLIEDLLR